MNITHTSTRPAKGQTWYAKNKGASTLITVYVTDVTSQTVELADDDKYSRRRRVLLTDIEFIELATKD